MKDGKIYSKYDFSGILKERRKACGFRSCEKLAAAMLPPKDEDEGKEAARLYAKQIETLRKKIERWEKGTSEPTISEFNTLCDLLDCDPEYLWGTCPTPKRETKSVMDATGLSQNTVDYLLLFKNRLDAFVCKHGNADLSVDRDFIDGLDILFMNNNQNNFTQCLCDISILSQTVKEYEANEEELSKYDCYIDDDRYDEDEVIGELCVKKVEYQNSISLLEYQSSTAFNSVVRNITRNVYDFHQDLLD